MVDEHQVLTEIVHLGVEQVPAVGRHRKAEIHGLVKRFLVCDRNGRLGGTVTDPGHFSNPALSPDEQRVAVGRMDPTTGTRQVWVFEVAHRTGSRLDASREAEDMPSWSRDGRHIAFLTGSRIVMRMVGSPETEQVIVKSVQRFGTPLGWTPDGRFLFTDVTQTQSHDVLMAAPNPADPPIPILSTRFLETQAQVSPDGRWIAYTSDESGRNEIYVRSFPSGEGKWPVSTGGGLEPAWRSDGKELFYLAADRALMVRVDECELVGAVLEDGLQPAERRRAFDPRISAGASDLVGSDRGRSVNSEGL